MAQDEVRFSDGELYTTFYKDLFVLKTTATIDRRPAEIDFSENDELSLRCRSPELSLCFREVSAQLGALLRKYGVCQVNSVWCGAKPFIHVAFPSAHGLKKFLDAKHKVEVDVASLFSQHLSQSTAESRPLSCEVETELFLIAPDAKHECAYYYSVTKGNCNECLSQLKKSKVFQFSTLFQSKPQENLAKDDQPTLLDLISQLEEVVDWFHLGLYLGVPEHELLSIDKSKRGDVKECRTGMLSWWLQSGTQRNWTSIVRAVEDIKMERLAGEIATKYVTVYALSLKDQSRGVPGRQPSEQPTLPAITKVSPELRQDLDGLEKRTPELSKTKEAINTEKKRKATIERKRFDTKQQLMVSSEKLTELTRERDDTKRELEEKEEELALLQLGEQQRIDDERLISDTKQKIQELEQDVSRVERQLIEAKDAQVTTLTKHMEELSEERDQIKTEIEEKECDLEIFRKKAHNQPKFRAVIERKEAEVGRLRSHMTEVEEDLSRTMEQHDKFREQLKETTAELSENCERVRGLEKYQAELERERSRVDAKLKMEIAKSKGVELPKADEASTVQHMDSLKQDVHDRDEEIRRLTSLLQTKEEMAEGRGGGGERGGGEVELSDVKAMLEEEKDRRLRSEEELKNLQGTVLDVAHASSRELSVPPPPQLQERDNQEKRIPDPHVVALRKFEAPTGTIAGLNEPWGVAVDKRGQIIIAEHGGHCISIYNSGKRIRSFGQKGSAPGQFNCPRGVAVDGAGNILVADQENNRIQKLTPGGSIIASVGSYGNLPLQFHNPLGIGICPSEKVYICDRRNHRVQILNPDLTFSTSFGSEGSGDGQFKYPWDVAFDSRGNVYITDSANHCIQVFTEDGHFLRKFGTKGSGDGELNLPASVSIDSDDVVYVAERNNHRISLFTSKGHFLRSFGTRGEGPGQFKEPRGITVDKEGLVYVCDRDNDRLQIW